MNIFFGVLIGLFVLVILIVLHELGHAIAARRNGVVVEEFGIGFPPTAWKKKLKNGILLSINYLPLGGFVKLKGEYDSASGEGTYGGASFWVKTKILLAGVTVNWLTAAVLFAILALAGMPKLMNNQIILPFDTRVEKSPLLVARVTEDSPADKMGLASQDEITHINDKKIDTAETLIATTKENSGKEVEIKYNRAGEAKSGKARLNTDDEAKDGGYLGVAPQQTETIYSTWSAPIMGLATTGQMTYETVKGVGSILGKSIGGFFGQFVGTEDSKNQAKQDLAYVSESVAGPVGILGVIFPAVIDSGVRYLVLLGALISLTLAVMNALPIPALDGGRWFTMAGFRLFKKDLTKEREENIQGAGFLVLLILTIMITWSDIGKLIP